jgi:hypothetical protein
MTRVRVSLANLVKVFFKKSGARLTIKSNPSIKVKSDGNRN